MTIPDSVTSIGYEAFDDDLILTVGRNSYAAEYCEKNNLSFVYAEKTASVLHTGPCGPGVTWTLTEDGVLRISGKGEVQLPAYENGLDEYGRGEPKELWQREARELVIEEGITAVGPAAFHNCEALSAVSIPETTRVQGNATFTGCEALADEDGFMLFRQVLYGYYGSDEKVIVPDGVERIENSAFRYADISGIVIPESAHSIGRNAFVNRFALRSAVIPASCSDISVEAFRGTGLEQAVRPRASQAASQEKSSRIINLYDAFNVLLALREDGTVSVAAVPVEGDPVYNYTEEDFEEAAHWTDIVDLVYSEDLLAGLRSDGTVCALSLSASWGEF